MDERPVIAASELQALLNVLHDDGRALTIRYPFFDLPLLTYDPRKGQVTHAITRDEFDTARDGRLPKTARLADDLPSWADLRDALLTSGAIGYQNEEALRESLARERENARQANNPNATFLAFDTNTLYHHLPTRNLSRLLPDGVGPLQLVVSQAVHDELDAAIANKYSSDDINSLKSKLAEGRQVATLFNRPYKKGRRAKSASHTMRDLEKRQRVVRASAGQTGSDKEANDRIITASYREFRKAANADVLLLTADHDMQEHALSAGLKTLHLELPKLDSFPTGQMDERILCRLVHDLTVTFACTHLGGLDARLWGDWSGKTPEMWATSALQLDHNPSVAAVQATLTDIRAARRMMP